MEQATKKDLGQHWLEDQSSLAAIISLADLKPTDIVLEIGPGLGYLTEALVKQAKKVLAVEIDNDLLKGLTDRFASNPNISIINQDIRRFNLRQLPAGYKVVANIPYYLTSYLVRLLSESVNPPSLVVLLLQREVAQRLAAQPGQMSILGVITQAYWAVELGRVVPRALFIPPPEVDSQIVKLSRRDVELLPAGLQKEFLRTVKIGFSQRRKTLSNSFSGGLHIPKVQAESYLLKANINPSRRAQELDLEDWQNLTKAIFT